MLRDGGSHWGNYVALREVEACWLTGLAIGKEPMRYWGPRVSVAEAAALQRGQERSGALRNRDPGSARHFLCTLSRVQRQKEWLGEGLPVSR